MKAYYFRIIITKKGRIFEKVLYKLSIKLNNPNDRAFIFWPD